MGVQLAGADLANFLGIAITLCRLRRPQTKGKVERGIRYAKENFWPARTFSDLADLNEQALIWCSEADNRIHQSLGITPNEAFLTEQPHLGPLPMRESLYGFEKRIRKVTADSFVSFAGVKYAVLHISLISDTESGVFGQSETRSIRVAIRCRV